MANEDGKTGNDSTESSWDSDSSMKGSEVLRSDIPPGRIPSYLENDIWDIKSLSIHMEPVSKPSATLDIYMKKCEERKAAEVNKIRADIKDLNEECEKCIRAAYEIMKCELKGIEGIIENWKLFVCSGEIPLTSVMAKRHKILNLTALHDLLKKRRGIILEFHRDIIDIEYYRRNKGCSILQKYFTSCTKLSLQKPGEMRELMELEILKTNQIVLSNIRYYEDVKLNLLLHGEKIETTFRDYVEKCRRNFALRLMETLREENKNINLDKYFFKTVEGKKAMKSLHDAREDILGIIHQQTGRTKFTPDEAESTVMKIQRAAENLDDCAKHVISIYKKVTYNVFQGQISTLEKVQQEFLHLPSEDDLPVKDTEMEELQKKIFAPLFQKQERLSQYISDLEVNWTEMMTEMQSSLRSTFLFLRDSSKIWDRHFERTNETKHMINMKIMTLVADQTVGDLMLEKDLSIAVDMLREEPLEDNLNDLLNKLFSILDGMEMIYVNNNAERLQVLDKYMSAMDAETKILLAEIEQFLEVYPNEFFNDYFDIHPSVGKQGNPFSMKETKSDSKLDESEQTVGLPMELQKCQYQTDALRNWKLGLREAIVFYSTVCAKEMSTNTKRWMERQTVSLNRSLEAKLAIHHARYHMIKTDIHDVRLAELQYHQRRLESHVLAVRNHMGDLSLLFSEYDEKIEHDLEHFKKYVTEALKLGSDCDNSMKATKITLEAHETLMKIQYLFQNSLDAFQTETTKSLEWIQSSNLNYLRSLKLFSEGGNYHPNEIATITKELDKLLIEAETHTKDVTSQAKQKSSVLQNQVIPESNAVLQRFKSHYEDLTFSEKINFAIKRVREFIKKEVRNLKYNRKLICLKVEHLITDVPGCGGLDLLSFIEEYWESVLNMAHQHCAYLLQPPLAKEEGEPVENKKSPKVELQVQVGLRFKGFDMGRPKSKSGDRKTANRVYLFNQKDPPISGTSFMENVCRCLWEVMVSLETVALAFYKTKRKSPISKHELIASNFAKCMKEIIMRFKYYHLQCEDVWLNEVKVYYAIVKRMQSVCNLFTEHAIRQFHQNRMNAITENHKTFVAKLANKMRLEDENHTALTDKLKPLHGYPGNKSLLIELIKEVKGYNGLTLNTIRDYGMQYKAYLKDRKYFYKIDIHDLCLKIQNIITAVYEPKFLLDNLMEQVEEVVKGRKKIAAAQENVKKRSKSPKNRKRKPNTPGSGDKKKAKKAARNSKSAGKKQNKKDSKDNDGENKGEAKNKKKIKISVPVEYRLSIDKPILSAKKRTVDKAIVTENDLPSDQDPCSSISQSQTTSSEELPVDVISLVEDAKKKFVQYLKFCSQQRAEQIEAAQKQTGTWQKLFMKNVEEVKKLYNCFVDKWTK